MYKKKILITGKGSYVGTSFMKWLEQWPEQYEVEEISVHGTAWRKHDFSKYDVVLHVAGIVHKQEKTEMKEMFFEVNAILPTEIAMEVKKAGVKQFVFLSTMAVYGEEGELLKKVVLNKKSVPSPKTMYGISKLEAEKKLNNLNDKKFNVVIVRPPMIYGDNCPGNYSRLKRLAVKIPVFPRIENERSMISIIKLCKDLKGYIDNENPGLYLPQDEQYTNTSRLIQELAATEGKNIHLSPILGWIVITFFKNVNIVRKMFGNLTYEK